MKATTLASWESKLHHLIARLPPRTVVSIYSKGRLEFLEKLKEEAPPETYVPPKRLGKKLWGIHFRSPLINSDGMFKNGECYSMVARQGAGGYLGGPGTWNYRRGNEKKGIYLPFVRYSRSGSASNWLGLPNEGDRINSQRASYLGRIANTPVGWGVTYSPNFQGEEKSAYLVKSMQLYDQAGVDFIEISEHCPNLVCDRSKDETLEKRLRYVKEHFLDQRTRRLPVIVKFSNDTPVDQLPELLDLLFELGYDGVNFGNTSTDYTKIREKIDKSERKLFDFYTKTFGGGVSGRPLKESSLELAARAVEYLKAGKPPQEFHIIRTGGIETWKDIQDSERAGISLNQWYTGYFENFRKYGHELYMKLFDSA